VSDAGNSDDAAPKRVIGRPFQPGQSGNPSGRPKAARELSELVRSLITDGEGRNKIVERLVEIAMTGRPGAPTTVRAAEVLLERGYGKAPVTVEDAEGNAVSAGLILLPMRVDDAG
jgi:hypothetical protein